jgi:hypothetical protein
MIRSIPRYDLKKNYLILPKHADALLFSEAVRSETGVFFEYAVEEIDVAETYPPGDLVAAEGCGPEERFGRFDPDQLLVGQRGYAELLLEGAEEVAPGYAGKGGEPVG